MHVRNGIDENSLRALFFDRRQHLPGPGIRANFQRRVPKHVDVAIVDVTAETQSNAFRRRGEFFRCLMKADVETALTVLSAFN